MNTVVKLLIYNKSILIFLKSLSKVVREQKETNLRWDKIFTLNYASIKLQPLMSLGIAIKDKVMRL